jgi:Transglutaminase-like superfamily
MTWLRSLIRKYATFVALSGSEKLLLIQALCLLPIVAILLQLKGLRFTQNLLLQLPHHQQSSDSSETQIWTTVRMVRVAVRYNQPWANCLKQSLVLWFLLRAQGIISELRIGVQTESAKFAAHAWVEYQGIVLNDTDDVHQRYQAFDRLFDRTGGERL